MNISTKVHVAIFAAIITVVAVISAQLLAIVFHPADILLRTVRGTVFISAIIAVPMGIWGGNQFRENMKLALKLQHLVNRDRLTDVATRDYFFTEMHNRNSVSGVSLMVDIDNFKRINDKFGHLAGDAVIKSVALTLEANVRSRDIVCRFGGEEFVVFLHEYTASDGFETAERLREAVAQTQVVFEDMKIDVTISIGGASKSPVSCINGAIQAADAALYVAKNQGRNRTIFEGSRATPVSRAN